MIPDSPQRTDAPVPPPTVTGSDNRAPDARMRELALKLIDRDALNWKRAHERIWGKR
jgi:hypothetical protein